VAIDTTRQREFNTLGACVPALHYMVDLAPRVRTIIEGFIDPGKYFVMSRARQYGKTTTLWALDRALRDRGDVVIHYGFILIRNSKIRRQSNKMCILAQYAGAKRMDRVNNSAPAQHYLPVQMLISRI
jgi:hypothetical protein